MLKKITNLLIYSAILLLPLYLVRFELFDIPTNLVEIMIGLAFFLWLSQLKKDSKIFSLPKIYWISFLLLFLGVIISALLNPNLTHEAGIIKGWFAVPFIFFLILLDWIDSDHKKKQILKLFFVSSATVGLISLFYLLTNNLTFDGRLQAFYLSPNHLAMFLAPGIIFGFFEIYRHSMSKGTSNVYKFTVSFFFLLVSSLMMLIALYFTFSYGAWLAIFSSLLISLLFSNLIKRSQKIKACLLTVLLAAVIFSFQLSHQKMTDVINLNARSSLASRAMIWHSAWKIGTDNPVWGIGPGNFQEKYLAYQKYFPLYLEWAVPQPHNLYLAFWLQAGLLGLLGFLILVGTWIAQIIKVLKNKKDVFLKTAVLSMLFSILIHGFVDTPYWKNDLALIFWIIIALGIQKTEQYSVSTQKKNS